MVGEGLSSNGTMVMSKGVHVARRSGAFGYYMLEDAVEIRNLVSQLSLQSSWFSQSRLLDYLLGDVVDKLKEGSQADSRVTLEICKSVSMTLLS